MVTRSSRAIALRVHRGGHSPRSGRPVRLLRSLLRESLTEILCDDALFPERVQGIIGPLVPEPGFEPGRPCGHGILRPRGRGGGSRFSQFVALSRVRGLRGVLYSPRIMVTQVETRLASDSCGPALHSAELHWSCRQTPTEHACMLYLVKVAPTHRSAQPPNRRA